ncbi:hypothetical protein HPP92_016950 [Vanilla planifolia]|uniref:snRNA-activating protein complex subunit n=1 Tax=Vanilla planifolia TaxID=51239 RepID=A0A835UQY3_VANPL|nr:hypothetical protein HPP92_016950 [Vanilla planifolia]
MEETNDYCYQDPGSHVSFARGGPIFVSNHVGPITSVLDFKASVLQELQVLETEFFSLTDDFDEELSVYDLKVFTEEELVEQALKEKSENGSVHDESLQIVEHANCPSSKAVINQKFLSDKEISCSGSANGTGRLGSSVLLCNSSILAHNDSEKVQKKKSNKRGRLFDRNTRAAELESNYFEKAKDLAKIKQRQDEDKSAARLHSFCGNSKSIEHAIVASEKIQKKELLHNDNSKSMKGSFVTSANIEKMQSLRSINSSMKVKAPTSQEHIPVCYPEVVLCIEIYHQRIPSMKVQEFLVLGSQNLTELRDNIYCLTDTLMQTAKTDDSSGYFLIEDTFYNDLRCPSSTDYSKPIFDWLQKNPNEAEQKWEFIMSGELKKKQKELLGNLDISCLPNFRAVDMHKIHFCDLRFQLGAGYLYCHQGNCKHIMVIRDMRLIHPEDPQNRAEYPLLTFQVRYRQRKCSVCQIYQATKMTVDDKWAQENPCYFCIKCYFLLHYKEDNTLLYPHTVFDYYHE